MSGAPKLDGRRARELEAELRRRALAVLSGDGRTPPLGEIGGAILAAAARIGEEATRRLDLAPAKQADNFYTAAGIGRDPARAATLPVSFVLAEGAKAVSSAPAATQVMADADGPVTFETVTRIDLVPGTIAALRGLDAEKDAISIPAASVMAAALPRVAPVARRLRGGAAAGATKVQVDPVAGLAPGTLLLLGTGDAAREYLAANVEGDLVTLEPPLETGLPENAPVAEATVFAPFAATARNHQSHALYLGHSKLLDVPSSVTITVTGTALPAAAEWSWWGQLGDDDPPAWHMLTPHDGKASRFTKPKGKPVKQTIRGRESLWLRAKLPGPSAASATARDVRIAVGGKLCGADKSERCDKYRDELNVGFEAIANTTPVVTNSPFHPFGREPRLFDSFYIGSDEAFSKAGADVSLCFEFGGPDFGLLADTGANQVFALGNGNTLYRADFRSDPPVLLPVPLPSSGGGSAPSLAAWSAGNDVRLALGGQGAVWVGTLTVDSKLDQTDVKWVQLSPDAAHRGLAIDRVAFSGAKPSLFAKAGDAILCWDTLDGSSEARRVVGSVSDLLPIQGAPGALLAIQTVSKAFYLKTADGAGFGYFAKANTLPEGPLTAWTDDAAGFSHLYVAGYGTDSGKKVVMLSRLDRNKAAAAPTTVSPATDFPALIPLRFEPAQSANTAAMPTLVAALSPPLRFIWTSAKTGFRTLRETQGIGASARSDRILLAGNGRTIVQRADSGLLYRPGEGSGEKIYPADTALVVVATAVPAGEVYAGFSGTERNGDGFALDPAIGAWRALRPLPNQSLENSADTVRIYAVADPAKSGEVAVKDKVTLFGPPAVAPAAPAAPAAAALSQPPVPASVEQPEDQDTGTEPDATDQDGGSEPASADPAKESAPSSGTFLQVDGDDIDIAVRVGGALKGIWHLTRDKTQDKKSKDKKRVGTWKGTWNKPANFPVPGSDPMTYTLLSAQPGSVPISHAAIARVPAAEQDAVLRFVSSDPAKKPDFASLGDQLLLLPPTQIVDGELRIPQPLPPWQILGPGATANPTLSWEYWNGESWWALGFRDLQDDTANFQTRGGVFFKAPADIRPTDVGGRTRYWIRARLVGGDYGEPTTIVTTRPAPNGGTQQTATRDVSTVRAPYITGLSLGYCAIEPVRPEIILTEDSLGAVDQTSANEAGLAFPVFTPIAELMNPVSAAEASAEAAAASESCDDPCPPPAAAAAPSPCDAPGAYQRCDSPCIAPPGYRAPPGAEATGFVRGLMLGFSKPFDGQTVSLYVDADPCGPPAELAADILRGGRFAPVNLISDTSYGLTESGILTLAFPGPPDSSDLFGASGHWLRLRPKGDGATWTPSLRGLHLNAVLARSIETRAMEGLGQSIGVGDQLFQLGEAPVDAASLELRVRELLADEEKADPDLDVVNYEAGPVGDWVRWTLTEDLVETGTPGRVFTLDAESGAIRFGNGANGRIPPLGADILAARYAHVIGRKANGVEAGKELQGLSPLAGVEKVIALDNGAGGSDAEALESARRRAAAKVRHGGRILSRADLEDYAATLAPGIAQVRADRKGGAVRLVVVMAGAEPRPSPAQLRAFTAAIRAVSGFGLARPGGLVVVGPRLLPLAVSLVLRPRAPDSFAEAAAQAKAALAALLDPATGNHDGRGWPLGRLPGAQDIAAALGAIEPLALPETVILERADRERAAERALPAAIPPDVLVRLDNLALDRAREAAA